MYTITRALNRLIGFLVGIKATDKAKEIINEVRSHNAKDWVKKQDRYYSGRECPRCHESNIVDALPVASGGIFGGTTDYFKCNGCNNAWKAYDSWNDYKKSEWEELDKHWIKEVNGEYRYMFIKDWMIFVLCALSIIITFFGLLHLSNL